MPNAKRKVYTMPRLRQQNKGTDTGGYRAKELPTMIEQQQQLLKEIEDAIKEIVSGVEYEDEASLPISVSSAESSGYGMA